MTPNPINCYCEFNTESINIWEYCQSIINHSKIDQIKWPEYCSWDFMTLPIEKINKDPTIKKIHDQYPIKLIGIIRTNPNFCYRWHRDLTRGPSLNMLLSEKTDSKCLFGLGNDDSYEYTSKGGMDLGSSNMINFIELKYKPKKCYLFNTQVLHTLINFSMTRYLFTVEFLENNKSLTYEKLLNFMKKENLLNFSETA